MTGYTYGWMDTWRDGWRTEHTLPAGKRTGHALHSCTWWCQIKSIAFT